MLRTKHTTLIILVTILSVVMLTACGNNTGTITPTPGTAQPTDAPGTPDTAQPTDVPETPTDTPDTQPDNTTGTTPSADPTPAVSGETAGLTAEFTKFDQNTSWDSSSATITCAGTSASFTGEGITVDGQKISITKDGTYVLSGTLSDGQIYINVTDTEKVRLVLNNADITCTYGPAIYIQNADKVALTLADQSTNTLSDGTAYSLAEGDKANACVYSKDDLSINGTGTLTVNGNYNNGIDSGNDLRIVNGTLTVKAKNHALKGNDSIAIQGGTITLNAGSDGMKSDTEGEADKGFVYINGGTLDITAADDGIQAVTSICIPAGSITFHVMDDKTNCDGITEIADGVVK